MKKVWVILADQLSYKFVGYNGFTPWIHTPNLDRLAREGVVFTQAYCSSPLCIPSRQSLYTGRNTRHHRCICDYRRLRKRTIWHHLGDRKVRSYAVGKLDFRWDKDQLHGITERPGAEDGAQDIFDGTNNFSSFLPDQHVTSLDREDDDQTLAITRHSLSLLRRNEPMFLFTSYLKPHESWDNKIWWDAPKTYWDIYRDRPVPPSEGDALRGYAANVSLLDDHVGRLLREAESEGLLDETLVIFASDHGEMAGEHGHWGKHFMHEEAVRVPMVLWHKGITPGTANNVVALIDLFPTVFDWLGQPCPKTDGVTLLKPRPRPEDYEVFIEVFWGLYRKRRYLDWQQRPLDYEGAVSALRRCIRQGQWKYVDTGGKGELFRVTPRGYRKMTQQAPQVVENYRRLMAWQYPVEGILSRYDFPRPKGFL